MTESAEAMGSSTKRMVDEFSSVVSDAQDLLQRANTEGGERARELRAQVEATLNSTKQRLQELQEQALERSRAAARVTDDYVRENPWQVLGVAALIGFIVGAVVARR